MADAKKASDKEEAAATEGGEGGGDEAGVKKAAKKKLVIIIIVVLVLIAGGGGAAFFLMGHKKEEPKKPEAAEAGKTAGAKGDEKGEAAPGKEDPKTKKQYLNIGEFLVNLNVSGKQASFLKMSCTLEVIGEDNKKAVEDNLPRIKDTFQVYLRELRAEDLKGSAGVFRLREALLLRVNKVIAPAQVSDILFEELIVQ